MTTKTYRIGPGMSQPYLQMLLHSGYLEEVETDPQPTLFSQTPPKGDQPWLSQGMALKAQGQAMALNAAGLADYREEFYDQVQVLAARPFRFTSEDVTATVGLPVERGLALTNNAVGALMTQAANKGWIVKKARTQALRPSSHATEITEWMGAQWKH